MSKPADIVSLSGGKDSTAMLLMMLERREPVHSVVFFDTGWEFPQMYDHLDLLERQTGVDIVRLKPKRPFGYWMFDRPMKARRGRHNGRVHRVGYGWPSAMRHWCTRLKANALTRYARSVDAGRWCIGMAADERHRAEAPTLNKVAEARYPLIEWDVTEADALAYCLERGYDWGGLYEIFHRVSCFCCPMQSLTELRKLRRHFPALWRRVLDMDARAPAHNPGFRGYTSAHALQRRFADEDRQKEFGFQADETPTPKDTPALAGV
ncbi:MAG: phosphoadenosine phosphosulfate reductase family protein [Phycisphaerae bacterium]